jgi:hypothetical protein
VRVIESWDCGARIQVYHGAVLATVEHHFPLAADRDKLSVANGGGFRDGASIVLCGDFAVMKDKFCRL